MKIIARGKSEQNQAMIDPWSIVHFGFGIAAGMIGVKGTHLVAATVAYEVFEQAFERTEVGQKLFKSLSGPETFPNAAFDVVIAQAGWWLAKRWSER